MSEIALALSLAGITFLITVIWGGPMIRILRRLRVGKQIRIEGPQRHFIKQGTPTMGGWLIVTPVILITGILNIVSLRSELNVIGKSILLPMGVMVLYAALGALDDWLGVRGGGSGLRGRWKFLAQTVVAVAAAIILRFVLDAPEMFLPNIPSEIPLGIWYVPIIAFVIVSESNAVNLSDGLDGLAGLIVATSFAAYGAIAMLQGQVFLVRFCFTVVGAIFAFLWFNVHPAELFMGDTGSLSLGATLAVVASMTGHWVLLPVIAIIPFSVVLSVVLQILYFRWTKGRRLFKMAPLQHHFELIGWSETQVVQRFWLVALLAAMVGVALALI